MNTLASPSRRPPWQVVVVILALLTVAIGLVVNDWVAGQPVSLPSSTQNKLECASYTPSHDGHALGDDETRRLVGVDLKVLAQRFACVRTYSVSEGLDTVPKVARELGLKVIMGLWIGSDAKNNDKEIEHGIALANQYSDVVTAVVVGNEVLLRRELSGTQLRSLIERVRAGTQVPVTYADVWEFWLRNAQLAEVTNFVTVHILPYWEDNPVGIDHALDHVRNIYAKVQDAFPGKRILIGETGWPSAGRPRLYAMPSLINEARFIREFVAYAEQNHVPYNIIEAFDQPWKRIQEGTVGGYWGLYDVDANPKFSFTGSVSARSNWQAELLIALLGAALFVVGGHFLLSNSTSRPSLQAFILLGIAGHVAGSVACAQWRYLSTANRYWLEWVATLSWSLCGWLLYGAIAIGLARWLDGASLVRRPANIAAVLNSLGHGSHSNQRTSQLLGVVRALLLIGTAYVCLALDYDGRGRDFPLAFIALPTFGLLLLEFAARTVNATTQDDYELGNEELLLSACLIISAIIIAWIETTANLRAIAWCAVCFKMGLLLIAPNLLWNARRRFAGTHPDQRSKQQTSAA
jgi:glucan 1,3-beta-glucosidase